MSDHNNCKKVSILSRMPEKYGIKPEDVLALKKAIEIIFRVFLSKIHNFSNYDYE